MAYIKTRYFWRAAAVALLLAAAVQAAAQSGGPYDLSWWTLDGGGGMFSTGGGYSLSGTAGQPDTGLLLGDQYSLLGGFWSSVSPLWHIYLPLVLRKY